MFVLPFENTDNGAKNVERNSHTKYFLPRVNMTNCNVLIEGRNFYDQPINDLVKQYDKIRSKDHYNVITVYLSKQKELDADSRAIQQIEFYEILKTNSQVWAVLEKSKETMLHFYKGTAKVLWIIQMFEYSKVNVKSLDRQLEQLKTAAKDKTGATLRMSLKMLDGNDLPHELLLTTRQKTKLRNAFNNNMSTDLTLSKAQISKIIQSGGFLGSLLSKLAGPLMKVAIPLAKNILDSLGITAAASAIDAGI